MTALLALLAHAPAFGANVTVKFCVTWTIDYTDSDGGDLLRGATTDGRGALVRFVKPDGSYFGHYMSWNGAEPGCKAFLLDDSVAYTVKLVRQASVNSNVIQVVDSSGTLVAGTWATGWVPVDQGVYPIISSSNPSARVIAAAGWALQRNNGGVTGQTYTFMLDECVTTGQGSCSGHVGYGYIYIADVHDAFKFIIVHELGHAIAAAANAMREAAFDLGADPDDCVPGHASSHEMNSKEYQSAAATEGIGNFYAAVSFNKDVTETDCQFEAYQDPLALEGWDWNADGDTADNWDNAIFSCEGAPVLGLGLSAADYFGDMCEATGVYYSRGTEFDWLRMWWDLRTDDAVSVADIFGIWAGARPDTWATWSDPNGTNNPAVRMSDGAEDVGGTALRAIFDAQAATNGTDR